jgi:hypothetical protein
VLLDRWGRQNDDGIMFTSDKPGRPSLLGASDLDAMVQEIEEGYYDELGHSRFFMSKAEAFLRS